jgi:transposase
MIRTVCPCCVSSRAQYHRHHTLRQRRRPTQELVAPNPIPGVGPTTAAAIVASVGEPQDFRNGRQFAAWLGLVPQAVQQRRQDSLGTHHQTRRRLPAHAAHPRRQSTLQSALRKPPEGRHRLQRWIVSVFSRIGYYKTLVAIANKHARIIWALLVKARHSTCGG